MVKRRRSARRKLLAKDVPATPAPSEAGDPSPLQLTDEELSAKVDDLASALQSAALGAAEGSDKPATSKAPGYSGDPNYTWTSAIVGHSKNGIPKLRLRRVAKDQAASSSGAQAAPAAGGDVPKNARKKSGK